MKNLNITKKTLAFLTSAVMCAMSAGCSAADFMKSSETSSSSTVEESAEPSPAADSLSNTVKKEKKEGLFSSRDLDPSYDKLTATVTLNGKSADTDGSGVTVKDGIITVTEEGVYRITGTLDDGQIVVDAENTKVQLILDNADITCSDSSAIYGKASEKIFITLAEKSENSLSDGKSYSETEDAPDACIYSNDSLTINGSGSLNIKGNYADGIHSKDDVVITGGTVDIVATADGIKGKDYVAVADGNISINAGEDGIKSTNSTDEGMGFIAIQGGSITIDAGNDAIQAETELNISDGDLDITTGGGSKNSTKTHSDEFRNGGFGGKRPDSFGDQDFGDMFGGDFGNGFSGGDFGDFNFDDFNFDDFNFDDFNFDDFNFDDFNFDDFNFDDFDFGDFDFGDFGNGEFDPFNGGMPSDNGANNLSNLKKDNDTTEENSDSTKGLKGGTSINISGGTITVDSADDSLHSNGSVKISGGTVEVKTGDDGIHADTEVNISDGKLTISESYEGIESAVINISGGTTEIYSSDDGINASDGTSQGGMGRYSEGVELNISGGTLYVNSDGDGLDSNGDFTISGGNVVVNGPTNNGNGALDGNNGIKITGGTLIASGASEMAEAPDEESTQNCVSATFDNDIKEGTIVTLADEEGNEIISFESDKKYNNVIISSPDIKDGKTYTFYKDISTNGKKDNYGIYSKGWNNDGDDAGSFTADETVSFIGKQSMYGGEPNNFGGKNQPEGKKELPTDEKGEAVMPDFGSGEGKRTRPGGKKYDKNSEETNTDKNIAE